MERYTKCDEYDKLQNNHKGIYHHQFHRHKKFRKEITLIPIPFYGKKSDNAADI